MEELTLREATVNDYDTIVSLMQQLNPDDPVIDRAAGFKTFNSILESVGLTVFIAEWLSRSVATCYLNVIPNLTRGAQSYAIIENVVTDSEYRHKGIGKALLKHAMAEAFAQGCYKVMLLTGRDSRVHAFYESCGMENISKTAFVKRKR